MNYRTVTIKLAFWLSLLVGTAAFAADEWSSRAQREQWTALLEEQSTGKNTSRALFAPTGHLVGLSGHFPIESKDPEVVKTWLEQHRQMLGLSLSEQFSFESIAPFVESLPVSKEKVQDTNVG